MQNFPYRTLIFLILLAGVFTLVSCYDKPDFIDQPMITFDRVFIDETRSDDSLIVVSLVVDFQDGDGDLGITDEERVSTTSIYREILRVEVVDTNISQNGDTTFTTIGINNPLGRNIFVTTYKEFGEEFIEMELPLPNFPNQNFTTFNGIFPPLFEDEDDDGPLEGEIEYRIEFPLISDPFNPRGFQINDLLRFEIQISDRAFNLSNIVTTDTIRVSPLSSIIP